MIRRLKFNQLEDLEEHEWKSRFPSSQEKTEEFFYTIFG